MYSKQLNSLIIIIWIGLSWVPDIYDCYAGVADEVRHLPGLDYPLPYKHYSGYLNATDNRRLHYWFFESQRNRLSDPVVLWLNGGPGCSSVLGALTEQGPLRVSPDGRELYPNPNSWNQVANVIFLEAPAGVGFSYKPDSKYATDDDQVATDNFAAIESFYRKFPHLKSNDFYIMGESYGGIYVPTLAVQVLRSMNGTGIDGNNGSGINFKGIAVGNGYLDQTLLGNSLLTFGYYHGLYDTKVWQQLLQNCCPINTTNTMLLSQFLQPSQQPQVPQFNQGRCDFVGNRTADCMAAVSLASGFIRKPGLNIYNLYADCVWPHHSSTGHLSSIGNSRLDHQNRTAAKYSRETFDRKLMIKTLNFTDEKQLLERLGVTPPCVDASYVDRWINQPEVRLALHVPDQVQQWTSCSLPVMAGYKNIYTTMKSQVLEVLQSPHNLNILIYNGDVDMACNFLGDEWFVEDLSLKLTQDYQTWYYGQQIAGFYKVYERLAFVTVRGSGHMVPTDKSGAALLMFQSFINSTGNVINFNNQ